MQSGQNDTSKFINLNLANGFKINPGFVIVVVAMIIIAFMSMRRPNKQNQSKL